MSDAGSVEPKQPDTESTMTAPSAATRSRTHTTLLAPDRRFNQNRGNRSESRPGHLRAGFGSLDRLVAVGADVVPDDLPVPHREGVDHLGGDHLVGDAGVPQAAVQPDRDHDVLADLDELDRLGVVLLHDLEV